MDRVDRPRPMPRPHRVKRERERARAGERRYSSSDGDEPTASTGLTADESHISPIENLDNTISRLYSYLSGSEGDADTDHQMSPLRGGGGGAGKEPWDRSRRHKSRSPGRPSYPSVSSGSRSRSSSPVSNCCIDSDLDERHIALHNRTMDTLGSSGTGENVYSRINDAATLPMPPIPPPPLESIPGPAVPPRINFQNLSTQTAVDRGSLPRQRRSGNYHDTEGEFEPQFLRQTPSGTFYVPQAQGSPPSSPPIPNFPRTVPRTSSLPHHPATLQHQSPHTPTHAFPEGTYTPGMHLRAATLPDHTTVPPPPPPPPVNHEPTIPGPQHPAAVASSNSTDSASYRVKKHIRSKCSWKITALVLVLVCVVLAAIVAYFVAMKIYDLNWELEKRPHDDLNSTLRPPNSGFKGAVPTPSVIVVQYPLGQRLERHLPPHDFWRTQFYLPDATAVKFNVTTAPDAVIAVYGRRNVRPTHAQYDFVHVADGGQSARSKRAAPAGSGPRSSPFVQHMDEGLWYVFIYNDNDSPQVVGFIGNEQDQQETDCPSDCHGRGECRSGQCLCSSRYTGWDCSQKMCAEDCVFGRCENQRCVCDDGWTGVRCDQVGCDRRCGNHGYCNNGSCICRPGWNGKHCTLNGCPNSCNNNGACQLFGDGWRCSCRDSWKGRACEVAMEIECENNRDDDRDGLIDCQDPDCCISISCKESMHCLTAPDPMEILLRKQPPSSTASFYDRMRFLVEEESVQSYATLTSFNQSQVSVIRGKVVSSDGSPLIGVRVSVVTQPLYGFTQTRELGLFDILVNGGGSVTLLFQRQPFAVKQVTVMVPWNRMITMDTVTLTLEEDGEPEEELCSEVSHDHYTMTPVVLSTWQHTQLGSCPSRSTIIPESQVLQESLQIPGTDVYLVYHSSETPGYMSTIMIQLTPDSIPDALAIVHLRVSVEGLVFEKVFEADPGLKYKFAWDRRNAYNQKVYGIVTAHVGVGYQYEECARIFWELQSATMSGYDITSSEIGGWNLHIHHTYNFQEGILHKGDGTNIYLKERPRKVVTVLGSGKQRRPVCRSCDGPAAEARLLAPVALASGRDGSLYVGDFNLVRKLSANREDVTSILEMDMTDSYKYFMTVSPLDGKLYVADDKSRTILRVKTMGAVRDLANNYEVVAGSGAQCTPGDTERCGDGGPATRAKLYMPKGIAINKNGIVYFVDGVNIRVIDKEGMISTLIGSQGKPQYWQPLPCEGVVSTSDVKLKWPTALAFNPLDDTLHILDDGMVLQVTKDNKVLMVAGRPLHCPPKKRSRNSLLSEEQAGPQLATDVLLLSPQHIAFSPHGDLFIVESDGQKVNQVRVVNTDGTIAHYAGAKSKCDCSEEDCSCFDPSEALATNMLLSDPTAITVTPDNVLHIADQGHLQIHSVVATLPDPDQYGQYEVLYPQTQELYIFNRYGQHIASKNIVTAQYVYNFTYNVNSYYGKLVRVTDSGNKMLTITRDYKTEAKEIIPPGGQKCKITIDHMSQLYVFIAADNATTRFTYLSNTGLLETKETSEGHTFLYQYDENGRLSTVVQPTGERSIVQTDVDPTDKARMQVSYLHDGSLVVEYPFNMVVTMETSPHPLLSTDHPLLVKRKIILPDELIHRLEWRYYLRREKMQMRRGKVIRRVGRRMRVGGAGGGAGGSSGAGGATGDQAGGASAWHGSGRPRLGDSYLHVPANPDAVNYEGKVLMINGDNLLTMEYDRETNSEAVMNSDMAEILVINYNAAGQPMEIIPDEPLQGLNMTYDKRGHVTQWQRGDMNIVNVYEDKTGHLAERRLSERATYRFLYKSANKPTDVILPSGKQYLFHYDDYGNLRSVIMPSLARHRFHSLTTLGSYRKLYEPPDAHGSYIEDYDSSGRLVQTLYPSGHRRVTYRYTALGQPLEELYDWSDVHYLYHPDTQMLRSVQLYSLAWFGYNCTLGYGPGDALVKTYTVDFQGEDLGLLGARFRYVYDVNYRVAVLEAFVANQKLPSYNVTYSSATGQLTKLKGFSVEYPRLHRDVIRDANVEIIREYDAVGRLSDVWFRFNNYVVATLEMKYDNLNRIHQWRRKVGSSDLKSFEYVYDIDGNVVEVLVSDQPTWAYETDPNSNIVGITYHRSTRAVTFNARNQVEVSGDESFIFDKDGFLVQRDSEVFEYNSRGRLRRAFETGQYDIYYFHDPKGRLVARKDAMGGYLTQFYYGDVIRPQRLTHVYDHNSGEVSTLYYDNRERLFAMERGEDTFYIVLDPIGSPMLVLDSMGGVSKQMNFDPLGQKIEDSAPDFYFPLGFQCGILDPVTQLVFLNSRVYDPMIGRWTSPDYEGLMAGFESVMETPEILNVYRHNSLLGSKPLQQSLMTEFASWMDALGYNLDSLVPHVTFNGQIRPLVDSVPQERLIPITSAFECAFERDMENFVRLSTVPRSKVTTRTQAEETLIKSFSPFPYIFGQGVMLSQKEDKVMVDILESANEELAVLATTLLNNSEVVNLHYTIHGRDTHYFVKRTLNEAIDDVKELSLRAEGVIQGINVTVHRQHETPEVMRYVDIRLHGNHTVLNLRYGTSLAVERRRVLEHAMERAVENAWRIERELVQSNKQTINSWTRQQKEELLSKGRVSAVQGRYIRDIATYPQLADDPKNIKFHAVLS